MKLRPPRKADWKPLLEYINEIIPEGRLSLKRKQTEGQEKEFVRQKIDNIEKGNCIYIIAEIKGKIAATAGLSRNKESSESHVCTLGIAVAKEFRRKGIGTLLINEMIKMAKEYWKSEIIILDCFEDNTPAFKLYEEMGFNEYGRLNGGLKKGNRYINKILMSKTIKR